METYPDINRIENFYGYSTDTKPTGVYLGERFYELDTDTVYIYDGTTPWKVSAFEGGTGSSGTTSGTGTLGACQW